MFRKPRSADTAGIKPLVGRPPTPPSSSTTMAPSRTAAKSKSAQPRISTFFGKASASAVNAQKSTNKPNGSILKFFQKVEPPTSFDRSLFVDAEASENVQTHTIDDSHQLLSEDELRFNENGYPQKRRRTRSSDELEPQYETDPDDAALPTAKSMQAEESKEKHYPNVGASDTSEINTGPFAEDSESENGEDLKPVQTLGPPANSEESKVEKMSIEDSGADPYLIGEPTKPSLKRESTSFLGHDNFEEFEDFDGEEFYEQGEEYLERRYMEEQAALEREFEDSACDDFREPQIQPKAASPPDANESYCPICDSSLSGVSTEDASLHVNNCLDGKPTPLPIRKKEEVSSPATGPSAKRFQRSAIPRPGQADPCSLATSTNGSSAFSKLMSSHAEDEAWATAAANEVAARGKPAFKRTCPFYKILPGFFTCVDAFRYGAVEGCNAYFLSHFHSDHYIGLTSSWCHGPIFCSKVTGNLVRQQLRVDPRWVVDLDWEQKTEIPKTQGVFVTMIPANHCPGSSLFLFEKVIGQGQNPRIQRVLHCGDFRACPAHVQHPLLRPDVVDLVTGKKRQQKLDVCYLDTTYLTPKYAFPCQESVIQACADMCISLGKDQVDEMDAWERTKKARAGIGMVKFVRKEPNEQSNSTDSSESASNTNPKGRGRLLVVVGTYSIGKERICLGIARALKSKIFAPPSKKRICLALEDSELTSLLTDDPYSAQIHMQMLMEIRPETLADYLTEYKPHFSRVVGFRPTGWNYRPPNSRFVESPLVQTVLHSDNWKSNYSMAELTSQRGSTRESSCFGVPYSEHSSFRELTMFCCALRIDKIIPTVNIGSAKSREKMKGWIEKWAMEKKKNGLFRVEDLAQSW